MRTVVGVERRSVNPNRRIIVTTRPPGWFQRSWLPVCRRLTKPIWTTAYVDIHHALSLHCRSMFGQPLS